MNLINNTEKITRIFKISTIFLLIMGLFIIGGCSSNQIYSLSGNITVDYDFTSVENSTANTKSLAPINSKSKKVQNYNNNEMIIGFQENLTKEEKEKIIKNTGGQKIRYIEGLNAAIVKVDSVQDQMMQVQSKQKVRYTEPNYQVQIHGTKTPNDSLYSSQWNHQMIDSPFSWFQETGSDKIRIAVLDTGIDSNHIDLAGRIDYDNGYNFVSDTEDSTDDHGHGTHVAGIIGASSNNDIGITGTTWKGEILPLKVLNSNGTGNYSDIADAMSYAAGISSDPSNPEPVDIINLSLGGGSDSTLLHDAIKKAREEGVLIVVSSGNDDSDQVSYPARYSETIAVGAVNSTGERAVYSNYGTNLDVLAPGGSEYYGILSTIPNDKYAAIHGTSMAAPHVSGLISLMLANGIEQDEVRDILHESSIHPGQDEFSYKYGYGLINTNFALNELNKVKVILGNKVDNKINKDQ